MPLTEATNARIRAIYIAVLHQMKGTRE